MRIELDNNYIVKRMDENNLTLCQVVERTKQDTGDIYQDDKVIGYYNSIQSALKGYVKYSLRGKDFTKVEQVIKDIELLHEEINQLKINI